VKLLVKFLIMIALLARGYAAGADGVGLMAHTHVDPAPDRAALLAAPSAHSDVASESLSEHGHDQPHPRSDSHSATIRPHEHRSHPIARHAHSHARPASNHQHEEREAGVVYVAAEDSANDASEALANVRALDGFVFLVPEPTARAPASGCGGLPASHDSIFKSRIPDPAERPPDH